MAIKWVLMSDGEHGLETLECSMCKNTFDELWAIRSDALSDEEIERFEKLGIDPLTGFWICENCLGHQGHVYGGNLSVIQVVPGWLDDLEKFKSIVREQK